MNTIIGGSGGVIGTLVLMLLLGVTAGCAYQVNSPARTVLTEQVSAPLDGAQTATVQIGAGSGNLAVDRLTGGKAVLASGALQYTLKQGAPVQRLNARSGHAELALQARPQGQPWFRFPWAACNGATTWQVHLNPQVQFELTAHSDGGNVALDLTGMVVTRLLAETAAGNVNVVLPDTTADVHVAVTSGAGNVTVAMGYGVTGSAVVDANSGAGNVEVHLPAGLAARIHASSGLGKVIVDPRFSQVDDATYQSPDYDSAANRVEITIKSGAGNAIVSAE